MLEVRNINTFYGKSHIIQGLSLNVEEGEAVALLGRNGVGKTTTIRSIIGFTPPRTGIFFSRANRMPGANPNLSPRWVWAWCRRGGGSSLT
jgi:branched-chain amino acid transport system ATP-binding protein